MATTRKKKSAVPARTPGDLRTETGRVWSERLRIAETYYKANSRDWRALHRLYSDVYAEQRKWGASISMAWSVVQTLINATYLQNPEPWIQSRKQGGTEGKDRMLRDLFKTIDRTTELETVMEHGQVLSAIEGYAVAWPYFEQQFDADEEEVPNPDYVPAQETEFGSTPGNGKPEMIRRKKITVREQKVSYDFVFAHDMRHDPEGRKWDFSDHRWLARIYTRPLQYFIDDFEANGEGSDFTAEGISMLRRFVQGGRGMRRPGQRANAAVESSGYQEKDPAYINVSMYEIWSKAEHKIVHIPVDAEFHVGESDWPVEWMSSDEYPATMIAYNWRPSDEDGKVGFYPIPLLRLIRGHLDNLNRIEPLFMDSATSDVKKYLAISGLLDAPAIARLQNDTNRDWIEIDISTLKKVFPGLASNPDSLDMKKLFQLLPTGEKSADAMRHLNAINHEIAMIREVTGLGALERGGDAGGESATATLARSQALSRRTERMSEASAKIVDRLHGKTFLLLKVKQTLPIPYQLSTGKNQSIWAEFLAEELWDMDLVFMHHAGSTRPPNRDQVKLEREKVATIALPVLQSMQMQRETKALMKWWLEPYDMDAPHGLFEDEVPELARAVAEIVLAVKSGRVSPESVGNQLVEAASALATATMTDADVQQVAQGAAEAANAAASAPAADAGTGSLPRPRSNGALAYSQMAGAAGAGVAGGIPAGV